MPSLIVRLLLFVSSYSPLALVFFFLLFEHHSRLAFAISAFGAIGLIGMFVYLRWAQTLAPFSVRIAHIQRRDGEAMSYIVTYVIPFLAVPFSSWQEGVALSIFFVVLGVLYVHSNMIYINPMLNLSGYHIYEVTLENGSIHILLARRRIGRITELSVVTIDDDLLLEKNR